MKKQTLLDLVHYLVEDSSLGSRNSAFTFGYVSIDARKGDKEALKIQKAIAKNFPDMVEGIGL